jgi:hypothetical protein
MSDETPINKKTRNPTVKKTFSLDDYKKKEGIADVPDKPLVWFPTSKSMQRATGLPGVAKGYVNLFRGFTNTGKSTALCEALVAAQQMGVLPIIIDTENNLGRQRLAKMGFDWDSGFYIDVDNDFLLEKFGKDPNNKRRVNQASIEDMADCINFYLDEQDAGNLPYDIIFAIDSLGTLDCLATINAKEKNTNDNNMWNAGAFEKTFKYLLNNTIPSSRKQNKQYTNTIMGVQKIWIDTLGQGVVKHKGGETFYYGSRLIYHFGGIASHGTKKVTATAKKREVAYGIETKVSVAKNQVDGPLGGVSFEGEIISTPHGFILKDDVDQYKKDNLSFFRDALGTDVTAEELQDNYVEIKANESFDLG